VECRNLNLTNVLSEAFHPVVPEDEPKLEAPKTPPKTEVPIPVVDYGAVIVALSLEKRWRDAQNVGEMLAIANP
jgi:hypothetical protein